jgi:predicted dehydrogenase
MRKVRTAVVGVGYLGKFHAEKHRLLPQVDLVGVCDIDTETGRRVAADCGVEYFPDHRALAGRIDAVTIAAATSSHYGLAKFFLEHGVHVFVEKPMTRSAREAETLVRLADERALKLQVGHIERFNPALLAAREKLGRVRFIECHRLAPFKARGADVDVVLDVMIHDLDVILSLVDGAPENVVAVGLSVLTAATDIANARIDFAGGAVANVTASRVSMSAQRKFRVFQHNQYLSIDFSSGELELLTSHGEWREGEMPYTRETWNLDLRPRPRHSSRRCATTRPAASAAATAGSRSSLPRPSSPTSSAARLVDRAALSRPGRAP